MKRSCDPPGRVWRLSGALGLGRLLSMWADELSLKLVVRNDLPPNLGSTQLDYLIVAAQGQALDLILMDMHMPGIDGLTATQQIRLLVPKVRQPRIIALTANTLSGERERCLAAGMDDQLSKPVGLPELKSALLAAASTIKPSVN